LGSVVIRHDEEDVRAFLGSESGCGQEEGGEEGGGLGFHGDWWKEE
jgi:hypothetical protein